MRNPFAVRFLKPSSEGSLVLNKATLRSIVILLFAGFSIHETCDAQSLRLKEASRLESEGKFREATSDLSKLLGTGVDSLSSDEKEKAIYEIERMRRIRIDYSLTKDELYAQLEHSIDGFSRNEFENLIDKGTFDSRTIDDTLRFVGPSRSNLFFRDSGIASRRVSPPDLHSFHEALYDECISIETESSHLDTPYVFPKTFQVRMEISADSGAAKPGEIVRAWLPVPRVFPYQDDLHVVKSSASAFVLAPATSSIRSVCMEQPADKTGGARFFVEYTYCTYGVRFILNPLSVKPYDTSSATYREFTREGPNIQFTDKIRTLSREIVGNETNPLVKARKIYDWISRNIKYSFAREYSTINNLSDYCLTKEYGDCGQEAMLFITLCRYNGVPARWQSGWFTFPHAKDIHDWTEIFVAPYGWVPVDPYMGIEAERYMNDLKEEQREKIHDFYFGGLDHYRMSANSDNNQLLAPAKRFFRSDNVDFQRGEMETVEKNIYFNESNYDLAVDEVTRK